MDDRYKYAIRFPHHVLWHPQQGLWNIYLIRMIKPYPVLRSLVIFLDSIIIFLISLSIRTCAVLFGCKRRFRNKTGKILYIDCGLRDSAEELHKFISWFSNDFDIASVGVEAIPTYSKASARVLNEYVDALQTEKHVTVEVINCALVGPDVTTKTLEFFVESESLYAKPKDNQKEKITVDARRLSDIISEVESTIEPDTIILRMNIEGSEASVIEDLLDTGKADRIAGFFGKWDDVFKKDPFGDAVFRKMLSKNGIQNFTFNERDLNRGEAGILGCAKLIREWAIRLVIRTRILYN